MENGPLISGAGSGVRGTGVAQEFPPAHARNSCDTIQPGGSVGTQPHHQEASSQNRPVFALQQEGQIAPEAVSRDGGEVLPRAASSQS